MARARRVWSVVDVAKHAGISHDAALRLLKRLDAASGGTLLMRSQGTNRRYTVLRGRLLMVAPELFDSLDLQAQVEQQAEIIEQLKLDQRRIVSMVGMHTRAIERMRRAS